MGLLAVRPLESPVPPAIVMHQPQPPAVSGSVRSSVMTVQMGTHARMAALMNDAEKNRRVAIEDPVRRLVQRSSVASTPGSMKMRVITVGELGFTHDVRLPEWHQRLQSMGYLLLPQEGPVQILRQFGERLPIAEHLYIATPEIYTHGGRRQHLLYIATTIHVVTLCVETVTVTRRQSEPEDIFTPKSRFIVGLP